MNNISQLVYIRDQWKCRRCHNRDGIHAHHVTYRSKGGKDTLNNLITLCWKCHRLHHDGKLDIIVVNVLDLDLDVKFERK